MWEKELEVAIKAGLKAREKILEVYHENFKVEMKEDNSPVTNADKGADKIIREMLSLAFPKYDFLTEESEDHASRLKNDYVWIIDPLDGTKDFVARDGGFTTNIALSYKHRIVVGVVVVPLTGEIYYATENNGAFYRDANGKETKIHVNDKTEDLTVLLSVFHTTEEEKALLKKHSDKIKHTVRLGSSLKPCHIAQGLGEITYRLSSQTKEWDTAACTLIVQEAGGLFVKLDGSPILYNREDVYNREGYIVVNRRENILL